MSSSGKRSRTTSIKQTSKTSHNSKKARSKEKESESEEKEIELETVYSNLDNCTEFHENDELNIYGVMLI